MIVSSVYVFGICAVLCILCLRGQILVYSRRVLQNLPVAKQTPVQLCWQRQNEVCLTVL